MPGRLRFSERAAKVTAKYKSIIHIWVITDVHTDFPQWIHSKDSLFRAYPQGYSQGYRSKSGFFKGIINSKRKGIFFSARGCAFFCLCRIEKRSIWACFPGGIKLL